MSLNMAKYDFKTTSIQGEHDQEVTGYDHDLSYPLECIANELAELNRLKRLELNEKYRRSDWAKDMQSDQAQ